MNKRLSKQEQKILNLLLDGDSAKEIAEKLSISVRTVDFHKTNIYRKLDVHNIQELITKYNSQNLLNLDTTDKFEKIKRMIPYIITCLFILVSIFLLFLLLKPASPPVKKRY